MADTLETLEIKVEHSATSAASEIRKLTSAVEGLSNALSQIKGTTSGVTQATSKAASGVKKLAQEASKAKSPLDNFVASLKRIAFYRIIRSVIKSITQAFQEGLEKAYLFSQGMTGAGARFAAAMDNIKSAGNQMKGQLGSAFISLLTAVEPILITLINLITKVADAFSQLFSAFTGRTYLKANATAAQFSDSMAKGAGAAKEWKNQLMGFDEINRLNNPSKGGGGGGSNPLAGYEMVDTPINEKLLDFINTIKEKVQPNIERLKESFERLKEAWDRFTENFDDSVLKDLATDLIALPINTIAGALVVVLDTLTLILDILNAINTGDWSKVWFDFKQLLYDLIVLVVDLFVGLTNLAMDALILVVGAIDAVIGTHFADDLRADKKAFNDMYNASKQSEDGLWGLKRVLGLTQETTESAATATEDLSSALVDAGMDTEDFESKTYGVRTAVDWVLNGFRDFGAEVGAIITSLFQPLENLCVWIDSVLQGFGLMKGINARVDAATANGSIYLQGFASGGFPDEGQLFFANEGNAPEMVGTIGGRTAVATNDDIVESVRQGVYDAVLAANNNGGNSTSFKLYLDSREIKYGLKQVDRAWG